MSAIGISGSATLTVGGFPVSSSNPVPISGNITSSSLSVGVIGSPAPTSADFIGVVDGSGNLRGVGASNPIRVDPTGTTSQPVDLYDSAGNGISSTTGFLNVYVQGGGSGGSNAAAGLTAANVPTSADYLGYNNASGKLTGVSASTPLPVTFSAGALSEMSFTNYGSPANESLNCYVVNPISVSFPSSMPVTQSTSPWVVSLASTTVTGSVAVTGTFWQATQPVSGTVAISNFPASQAVTGTFWQATQPVSGTFWQTTQPVSGTVGISAAQTIAVTNAGTFVVQASIAASQTIAVTNTGTFAVQATGTFYQATQPVSVASGQIAAGAISAGAFVSGSILSGALASGAVVDLTNVTSALAATAPTKALATSGLAATALPTAVTGGQAVLPMTDKFGRQVVLTGAPRDIVGTAALTITASTGSNSLIAAIASTYCDITSLTITNSSATATLLTLSDGTTSYIFSAGVGPGWGFTIPFNPPLPAASVNTAWTLTCGTSVSSVYIVGQFIKNK